MIGLLCDSTEYGAPRFEGVLGHLAMAPKRSGHARVIGIVGCRRGDGATFVVNELARSLARGERRHEVIICAGSVVSAGTGLDGTEVRDCCVVTREAGVWRFEPPTPAFGSEPCDHAALRSTLSTLAVEFDSVLLDLGAAATSGAVWRLAQHVDDLLLVVAAGETKRSQIAYAQSILKQAGGRLSGCILNRRTYPLPRVLYRMLEE